MLELWVTRVSMSLLVLLHHATAQTLTNVTVDDTDLTRMTYVGNWEPNAIHLSVLNIGGSHTLSSDPSGSATFTFTGVAVYYLASKWPYHVDSYVALDGGVPVLVDMTGPLQFSQNGEETIAAEALWGATGLSNGIHRVVVTIGPSNYAVVDGFTYTTQSASSTFQPIATVIYTTTVGPNLGASSTTQETVSPTFSTAATTSEPQSTSTVTIALAVIASVSFLILLVLFIVFYMRRRRKIAAAYDHAGRHGARNGVSVYGVNAHNNATYSTDPPAYRTAAGSPGVEMAGVTMATPPYGQDAYGLQPASNRVLAVAAAGGHTGGHAHNATAAYTNGRGYNVGESGGRNDTAGYTTSANTVPAATLPPAGAPSPLLERRVTKDRTKDGRRGNLPTK